MSLLRSLLLFLALCTVLSEAKRKRPKANSGAGEGGNDDDLIPIPSHYLDEDSIHDYDYGDSYEDEEQPPERPKKEKKKKGGAAGSTLSPAASPAGNRLVTPDPQLLPTSLPKGDLSQVARPIFLKEPQDTYVFKNRPAGLHCRVAHARSVHFSCNSEVMSPTHVEHHVEPESGVRYTEAVLEINRDQVEEFFGDFTCACVASSGKGADMSRHALVAYAYLKKYFEMAPYSQQVSVGTQTQMRCIPPKGKPQPTISWFRNGQPIKSGESSQFLVTVAGHLILVDPKLSDSGNYTCVAENLATRRESPQATLTVYLDGGWSPWSSWSSCPLACTAGRTAQRRTRSCDSPKPMNGGQPCPGQAMQKRPCNNDCKGLPIDGGWSSWSSWSSCSPDCFQHRRRTCTSPEPGSGGSYCPGLDLQSKNCSHGFCQSTHKLVMYGPASSSPPSSSSSSGDDVIHQSSSSSSSSSSAVWDAQSITLYVVIAVAAVVFTLVILVVVRLLKRKGANPNGYTLTSTDYGYGSDESKKASSSLSYSPDLTRGTNHQNPSANPLLQPSRSHPTSIIRSNAGLVRPTPPTATPSTMCYDYSYPDSNSNHSSAKSTGMASSGQSTTVASCLLAPNMNKEESRPASEHHYEQPMVVFQQQQLSPGSVTGSGTSQSRQSSTGGRGSNSRGERGSSSGTFDREPVTSTPLPPPSHSPPGLPVKSSSSSPSHQSSHDPKFTCWANVSSAGARLSLPEAGAALTVPPGALAQGHTMDIFLSVTKMVTQPSPCRNGETLLSSVITCGPVAASSRLKKPVVLSLEHCASLRHGNWQMTVVQSDDLSSSSNPCSWSRVVTLGQETINTPVYAQLDLSQCHIMTDTLSSFALVGSSGASGPATKNLRLAAFAQEGEGSKQCADLTVRVYCLQDTDSALALATDSERHYNGRLLGAPTSVTLMDTDEPLCLALDTLGPGWACQKGADYMEVPFYHLWSSASPQLHCSFSLKRCPGASSQLDMNLAILQKGSGKQSLSISCDLSQRGSLYFVSYPSPNNGNPEALSTQSTKLRLATNVLSALAGLLDPPNPQGTDWRLLAERLNVHRYVTFFATRPSPTEAILALWEARAREVLAVSNLINVLRGMGRFDAAAVLERDM